MLENTAYVGLSRQLVLHRQMDMIANNITNMNTTAYKAQMMMFAEYLVPQGQTGASAMGHVMSMVQDLAMMRQMTQGVIKADRKFPGPGHRGQGLFRGRDPGRPALHP